MPADIPTSAPPAKPSAGLRFLFRALASKNYRLFVTGQLVSLIGTWLTITATGWLVYRLTGNKSTLGIVTAAGQIPAFALSLFAGVIVDRCRRIPLLKWTQTLSMLQSFGLMAVAFSTAKYADHVPPVIAASAVTALSALAVFQGIVNAFDIPARQSLVVDLVDNRNDLPNAIALNSSMFNLARAIGPLVAGSLIYVLNEGWCFAIDGISYAAVLIALSMMRIREPDRSTRSPGRKLRHELHEGLRYVWNFKALRSILTLLALISFSSASASLFIPVYAKDILHGNSLTQAFLMAAGAVGALTAAIRLAARKTVVGLGKVMLVAAVSLSLGMTLHGLSHSLPLCMLALAIVGFSTMTLMASGNTLLQTLVDDRMRGRVMSLFAMAFMGMMPLGSLTAGFLADSPFGTQPTVILGGLLCLLSAAYFALRLPAIRREVRPLYLQKGILPPIAPALAATEATIQESNKM